MELVSELTGPATGMVLLLQDSRWARSMRIETVLLHPPETMATVRLDWIRILSGLERRLIDASVSPHHFPVDQNLIVFRLKHRMNCSAYPAVRDYAS